MLATLIHDSSTVILAGIEKVDPVPPGDPKKFMTILSWVMWAAAIATLGGFIVAAAMLAYQRMQGGGGDAQGKLIGAMIGAALISMSITIINTLVF